jgi:hypothetical protein
MAGIDRSKLPTVEEAREAIRERNAEKEIPAPVWDRDRANEVWQDSVINAAIAKITGRFDEPKPERGALAGGSSDRQHAANDNSDRPAVNALAAMLQKPSVQREESREPPANNNEAEREKLTAFGFDAAKPATLAKWEELGTRVDAGRITEKDRLRELAQYLWNEDDKERRTGQNPEKQPEQQPARERQQEPDRDR